MTPDTDVHPLPASSIGARDQEADVVIAGYGVAGAAAAVEAADQALPGLYAAGRCTAGLAACGYASGISVGAGSFYGRRAGRAAAKG